MAESRAVIDMGEGATDPKSSLVPKEPTFVKELDREILLRNKEPTF